MLELGTYFIGRAFFVCKSIARHVIVPAVISLSGKYPVIRNLIAYSLQF